MNELTKNERLKNIEIKTKYRKKVVYLVFLITVLSLLFSCSKDDIEGIWIDNTNFSKNMRIVYNSGGARYPEPFTFYVLEFNSNNEVKLLLDTKFRGKETIRIIIANGKYNIIGEKNFEISFPDSIMDGKMSVLSKKIEIKEKYKLTKENDPFRLLARSISSISILFCGSMGL